MKLNGRTGATLAAAAALLMMNATVPVTPASAAAKVKCLGVNGCKGKSACKTAGSSCAGHNSCKGKGFLLLTKDACLAKGGTVG
jgi:uncharacterized membrane protein